MIADLKPYPAMKDSGVEWLGKVPEHWEVRRLKYLLRERDRRSTGGTEQLLSVSQYTGVTERRARDGTNEPDTRAASLIGYKCVDPDELVVNIMLAWNGSMGVSAYPGICSPAYCVYRFNSHAVPWYFHHLLRSPTYKARIKAASTGVVESRLRLYTDDLYCLEGLLPPLSEQAAIVRYLDYVDRRVRRLVRAKRKLIALLTEQKQSIVHRAVTRGLDPNVPLKDSGIEWLGQVPKHWETIKIKGLARTGYKTFVDGDWIESPYITSDGIRLIQTGNIGTGKYREKGFRYISEGTFDKFNCTEFDPGDVLICRLGEPVARSCLAPDLGKRMITSVDVCILKLAEGASSKFVVYSMSSRSYLDWVGSLVRGSTRDRVSRSMLGSFSVPLPPLLEQAAIVEHIEEAIAEIDAAIALANREIDLLNEYRTRLVVDVVTGKLDVREAAAALPGEDPLDVEDELDDAVDPGSVANLEGLDAMLEGAAA